jgi:GNAT superfamily N-acetyltransferase
VKFAVVLIAVLAAAAIAAFVVAVRRDRDPIPQRVADCVQKGGGTVIHSQDTLGSLRPDVLAGARERVTATRYRLGRDRGVLLAGGGPALLVLSGHRGPGLGGDLLRRAYDHPERFALVALVPHGQDALLARCARAGG